MHFMSSSLKRNSIQIVFNIVKYRIENITAAIEYDKQ